MAKKCPPGVICFENATLVIFIVVTGFVLYQFVYLPQQQKQISGSNNPSVTHNEHVVHHRVPVTVNTQRMEYSYKQVGILTRLNHKEVILPLQGRMVNTSRVKWQYYTMNDSNNQVRLPISVNGRSATDEYGVDELVNGDTVYVQGYDDVFKVTIYENNRYMYNPL
jgi:hypothetical protein